MSDKFSKKEVEEMIIQGVEESLVEIGFRIEPKDKIVIKGAVQTTIEMISQFGNDIDWDND